MNKNLKIVLVVLAISLCISTAAIVFYMFTSGVKAGEYPPPRLFMSAASGNTDNRTLLVNFTSNTNQEYIIENATLIKGTPVLDMSYTPPNAYPIEDFMPTQLPAKQTLILTFDLDKYQLTPGKYFIRFYIPQYGFAAKTFTIQ